MTKNTGLKLVHRLTAQDDKEQIGSAIAASSLQLEQMSTFTKGQALIFHEKTLKPFQVQIAEWMHPDISYDYANDAELFLAICTRDVVRTALYAAFDNWVDKKVNTIEDDIISWQKRYLQLLKNTQRSARQESALLLDREHLKDECRKITKHGERLRSLWSIEKVHDESLSDAFSHLSDEESRLINMLDEVPPLQ